MPGLIILKQPYPNGLKLAIDLEFIRPSTLIELANDLLVATEHAREDNKKEAEELGKLHRQVLSYLEEVHGDEFLELADY